MVMRDKSPSPKRRQQGGPRSPFIAKGVRRAHMNHTYLRYALTESFGVISSGDVVCDARYALLIFEHIECRCAEARSKLTDLPPS